MDQETNVDQQGGMPMPGSPSGGQGKMFAIAAIVVIILGLGVYFVGSRGAKAPVSMDKNSPEAVMKNDTTPPAAPGENTEAMMDNSDASVKTFDISGKPFEFSIKEIKVKKGDKVRINLSIEQGMHDWVVDEFNARTKQITTGQTDSMEFVADKTGTFEYYCSVGTHRQMGMVGKLIVE